MEPTPAGPSSAFGRPFAGPRKAKRSEVPVAVKAPRPALRSLSPGCARDDGEAGKVRRARREAARHAPCERRSVFYAVAQTLQARPGYSAESSPAIARCSSRPGRIRALRPVNTRSAQPARLLWTLLLSPFLGPLSSLPFVCLYIKGAPARCKVLSRPGVRHPRDGGDNRSAVLGLSPRPANSAGESGVDAVAAAGGGPGCGHGSRPAVKGSGGAVGCLEDAGHKEPAGAAAALQPPLLPLPPPPAPLAPVTLTRGFTLRS